ncbi:MAG: tRNA lysidine(34) synthetase TilS [Planctomycetales bacterium]|nr:tRNA lysidine(34) synthetase TilS [Planctomycetales bacterium]
MPDDPTFESLLAASWPPAAWHDVGVVLAVSGGADSVALLRAMSALKTAGAGSLVVAHFNHALRGDESDEDARFVARLAKELAAECFVERADHATRRLDERAATAENVDDASLAASEATSRAARYDFLIRVAQRSGARYVVTAHTLDDQAETVLHRIVRGTGLNGLRGIRRVRPLTPDVSLIRPLLSVRRSQVVAYLKKLGQAFRTDATNEQPVYTRNRIRLELLPLLAANYNSQIADSLVRLAELAGEACDVIQPLVEHTLGSALIRSSEREVTLNAERLADEPPFIRRELFIAVWDQQQWPRGRMSFDAWQQLVALTEQFVRETELSLPDGVRARKQRGQVTLARAER